MTSALASKAISEIKYKYIKAKADKSFADGQLSDADQLYTQAMQLCNDPALIPKLYSNRSLVRLKANRLHQAKEDAQHAVTLAPTWHKAYLRLAAAHNALQQPVLAAEVLAQGCRACRAQQTNTHVLHVQLRTTVASMTSHELAQGLLRIWLNTPPCTTHCIDASSQQQQHMLAYLMHGLQPTITMLHKCILARHAQQQKEEHEMLEALAVPSLKGGANNNNKNNNSSSSSSSGRGGRTTTRPPDTKNIPTHQLFMYEMYLESVHAGTMDVVHALLLLCIYAHHVGEYRVAVQAAVLVVGVETLPAVLVDACVACGYMDGRGWVGLLSSESGNVKQQVCDGNDLSYNTKGFLDAYTIIADALQHHMKHHEEVLGGGVQTVGSVQTDDVLGGRVQTDDVVLHGWAAALVLAANRPRDGRMMMMVPPSTLGKAKAALALIPNPTQLLLSLHTGPAGPLYCPRAFGAVLPPVYEHAATVVGGHAHAVVGGKGVRKGKGASMLVAVMMQFDNKNVRTLPGPLRQSLLHHVALLLNSSVLLNSTQPALPLNSTQPEVDHSHPPVTDIQEHSHPPVTVTLERVQFNDKGVCVTVHCLMMGWEDETQGAVAVQIQHTLMTLLPPAITDTLGTLHAVHVQPVAAVPTSTCHMPTSTARTDPVTQQRTPNTLSPPSNVINIINNICNINVNNKNNISNKNNIGKNDCSNKGDVIATSPSSATTPTISSTGYALVYADGRVVEQNRVHHANVFGLSRVLYDARQLPSEQQQVWVQPDASSCRWRQSATEVVVLVISVPLDLLRHAHTGLVYFQGTLAYPINPGTSLWTYQGAPAGTAQLRGTDQPEGLVLYLGKQARASMQGAAAACASWWSRLLEQHQEIPWDAYEKDMSDLPQYVLQQHRLEQHQRRCLKLEAGRATDTKECA